MENRNSTLESQKPDGDLKVAATNFKGDGLKSAPYKYLLTRSQPLARDTGLGGGNDNVNAWSLDVQRVDGDGAGISTR